MGWGIMYLHNLLRLMVLHLLQLLLLLLNELLLLLQQLLGLHVLVHLLGHVHGARLLLGHGSHLQTLALGQHHSSCLMHGGVVLALQHWHGLHRLLHLLKLNHALLARRLVNHSLLGRRLLKKNRTLLCRRLLHRNHALLCRRLMQRNHTLHGRRLRNHTLLGRRLGDILMWVSRLLSN